VIGIVVAVLLVPTVGMAVYFSVKTSAAVSDIPRITDALPTGSRPPVASPSVQSANAPMNILLIGTDRRDPTERGRSDSFIVVHISADRKNAYLVSFPRDMWVDIPGHGQAKINAAYSYGGEALAVETIEKLTGARIDHVATTNFENFVGLVDVVGGVTVNNPVASTGKDTMTGVVYTWPKGPVTLDGASALAFSRQRYELPNGDLDRALRQRALLKALALKIATPEVIANPVTLNTMIGSISQYVSVDSAMTNDVILGLATSMRITGEDHIFMLQAPISGFGKSSTGESIDVVDTTGVASLGRALSTDTMETYRAAHPK
jgi:LCP family protein required for cell wall assembly